MEFKKGDEVFVWDNSRERGENARYFAFDDYSAGTWNKTHLVIVDGGSSLIHFKNCEPRRPDLKVDDPVIVWLKGGDELRRHFSRWGEDGRIRTFDGGQTSYTEECGDTPWDNYRLPTKDELKG